MIIANKLGPNCSTLNNGSTASLKANDDSDETNLHFAAGRSELDRILRLSSRQRVQVGKV